MNFSTEHVDSIKVKQDSGYFTFRAKSKITFFLFYFCM